MGSTRCRHFVQNAWKKDLCSNCFKGRDEHAAPVRLVPRTIVPPPAPTQGILKGQKWTRSKTHRVYFPAEECEVIGEGGEDAGPPSDDDSDDQDDADWGKPVVEDDPQEQEQARLLQALTRSNTDFNSVAANLEGTAPSPPAAAKTSSGSTASSKQQRAQSALQLGRPQTDAEGRKQTLLVSVQPFGKPAATTTAPASTPAAAVSTAPAPAQPEHVTKIPVATPPSSAACNGVVLKSIVHTGEDAPSPSPPPATKVPSGDATPAAAPTPDPAPARPAPTLLKLNDAQTGKHAVTASTPAPLSSKHMFLKSFVEPAEAPTVCVSAATIQDSAAKTTASSPSPTASPARSSPASAVKTSPTNPVKATPAIPAKTTPASPVKTTPATIVKSSPTSQIKTAPASPAKTSPAAKTTPTMTSTTTVTGGSTARREGKRTHITRGTPISKNNEMLLKTKFIPLRTSTIINNNNNKRNSEDSKLRGDPVMLIEAKQLDSSDEDERPYSNVQVQSHKNLDDAPGAQTKRLASLLAPLGVADVSVGSRELAGEPDGRADPDSSSESGSEPPALPQSPPPAVDPRPSFLHGLTARLAANNNAATITASATAGSPAAEKPRVPFKSSTVVQAATAQQLHQQRWSQVISTQPKTVTAVEPPQVALGHSVTLGAHSGHSIAQALAQANSFVSMSPNAGQGQPQPSPRRALSMSTDSLSGGLSPTKHPMMYDTERKKPGTKVRFSLRKFLGLSKDGGSLRGDGGPGSGFADGGLSSLGSSPDPLAPPQPRPRPRLEIIHPSDLSGRGVEVLRASGVEAPLRRNSDAASVVDGAGLSAGSDYSGDNGVKGRPTKPPPPPRSQSLENDVTVSPSRPSRPPPPKSAHVDLLMRRHSPSAAPSPAPSTAPGHSVYANIAPAAEALARSSVAPTKPQRTGSVRDATGDSPRRTPSANPGSAGSNADPVKQEAATRSCSLSSQPEDSGYESVELSDSTQPQSMTDSENVYECVNSTGERSSSPECDSKNSGVAAGEGGVGVGMAGTTLRAGSSSGAADRPTSSSTHYCGSETESDIYSPYSFYGGSDEGDEGEADSAWKWRSRARKGRSVVHKSMEDNYDAVVGANLEALAQLFEQIRTGPTVPSALRPLKTSSALNWCDFSVTPSTQSQPAPVVAGRWVFLSAQWDGHPVTVGVLPDGSAGCAKAWRGGGRGAFPFALMPITEFCDRVPASCLPAAAARTSGTQLEALVAVLARARVDTLASYGSWLRAGTGAVDSDEDAAWREAGLALLQLLNALLALQALRQDQAVHPDSVVFLRDPGQAAAQSHDEHHDSTPQLALLHGMGTTASTDADVTRSLCACALAGVRALLPGAPPSPLLCSLLEAKVSEDEAEPSAASEAEQGGLSRAKAVLEYWLWGPAEAVSSLAALQRWLDLERATVLHRLVCARAAAGPHHRLAIQQQSHLLFLVHTSAATMCDASRLLESARVSPLETTT
ncbi:mucin-5AC [Thrips palmi]|uniref:Mucin-5AC n=1 Tax=Thrips palmi TaxID=161013 RepID=A0A6P8ZIX4_THRPL|nr:mucin-5AC [Thrips palmi]